MAEYKMKGWVARDSEMIGDTDLYFGIKKPIRYCGMWFYFGDYLELPTEMFPDLRWKDEPIKLEITIKECKDENDEN